MKRIFAACAVALAVLAGEGAEFNVGSYNIRFISGSDTGVYSWNARKKYVARTVTDAAMDIVGFNEVRLGKQESDLQELLPAYDMVGWNGSDGLTRQGEFGMNRVAFLREKFELVEEGNYFLNRELGEWSLPWDNSQYENVRHTSWARLRVKETGEEFYCFCSHLDHLGNIARMLQSHLNLAMVRRIAGHMPVIYLGDQNSNISRVNYLNLFNANFDDTFAAGGGEAKYGSDPATCGQWKEDYSTVRRIDYIWVNGMEVLDYNHHTDHYDLGISPSDHIAISARVRLQIPELEMRRRYVKAGASGNGTRQQPFGSIAEAIAAAERGDTIFVAADEYLLEKPLTVNKTVMLFGGYDDNFTEVTGLTRLRAKGDIRVVSQPKGNSDIELRHFGIYGGNLTAETGDGAGVMAHGARAILRYCEIADCHAARDGGGIDALGQLILDHVRFLRNSAGRRGGAYCADNPSKRYWFNMPVTNCYFEENSAADGSAIYLPRFVYGYVANCTFHANKASAGSTVYLQAIGKDDNSRLDAHLSVFNNTFVENVATSGAPAFKADLEPLGPVSVVGNTILSNSGDGHAVQLLGGKPYVAGNIIALNAGGDMSLAASSVSASHNLFTSASTVTHTPNSADIIFADGEEATKALACAVDCEVAAGRLIPRLSVAEDAPAAQTEGTEALTAPGLLDYVWSGGGLPDGTDFAVPVVKILNPAIGEGSLCRLPVSRLREATVKADFNFDCMADGVLEADAAGYPRPADGTATIGASEFRGGDSLTPPMLIDEAKENAPVEYFNMQGMRVVRPETGSPVIRRRGAVVEKVIVK